ncbi:uncharacterized protein isoform X4 [Leptinotarsa decemlineata]|uniref:uncharacterized protein isoform X4 n=1 Tax=Leptinotarsa decemlineata TaxID=7539 RepID=UPI003D306213
MSCHSKVCIMNTRSRRLIALAKINNEIEVDTWTENNLIFLPKHESTQGTTREQQIAAIQDLPGLEDDEKETDDNEVKENEFDRQIVKEPDDGIQEKIDYVFEKTKVSAKKKAHVAHKVWSQEEKEAVVEFFRMNIKKSIVPGKSQCVKCIEEHPVLKSRDWKKIKYFIKNQIQKNKCSKRN